MEHLNIIQLQQYNKKMRHIMTKITDKVTLIKLSNTIASNQEAIQMHELVRSVEFNLSRYEMTTR